MNHQWLILLLLIIPVVEAKNYSSPNFIVTQSQSANFHANLSSPNFQTQLYQPQQLTFNQSSQTFRACHGYYCLLSIITSTIGISGGGVGGAATELGAVCRKDYALVKIKGELICLPLVSIKRLLQEENLLLLLLLLMILSIYFLTRKKKKGVPVGN